MSGIWFGAVASSISAGPGIPTSLTVTSSGNAQISISWASGVGSPTGYDVQRSPDNSTWTTVSSLQAGTTYQELAVSGSGFTGLWYFRVRAHNASGFSGYTSSVNASPFLLYDTFGGSNGTTLPSHTMNVGTGWTQYTGAGVFELNGSNQCLQTVSALSLNNVVTADSGQANVTIETQIVIPASTSTIYVAGVSARVFDSTHYYYGALENDVANSSYAAIGELAGGSAITRAQASASYFNATFTIDFILSGANTTLKINGSSVLTYNSATNNQTVTKHGLFTYFNSSYIAMPFQNFSVHN